MIRTPSIAAFAALLLSSTPTLASCLVAGDSIAVGLGSALGCTTQAKVGIPSGAVIGRVRPGYTLTVISAGSNDPANPRLATNLRAARARASGRVVWVVPANGAARAVRAVAAEHGDIAIGFAAGRDHIHPTSYGALARAVRAVAG